MAIWYGGDRAQRTLAPNGVTILWVAGSIGRIDAATIEVEVAARGRGAVVAVATGIV